MTSSSTDQNEKDWNEMTAELSRASAAPTRSPTVAAVVSKVMWTLASFPIIASLALGSLALRSRLDFGKWPALNDPDPKVFGIHYDIALIGFLAAFAAALIVPIVALVAFAIGERRITVRPMVIAFISFALYFLFLRSDVGDIGSWFAD